MKDVYVFKAAFPTKVVLFVKDQEKHPAALVMDRERQMWAQGPDDVPAVIYY